MSEEYNGLNEEPEKKSEDTTKIDKRGEEGGEIINDSYTADFDDATKEMTPEDLQRIGAGPEDDDTREISPEELEDIRNKRSSEESRVLRAGYVEDEIEKMEQEDLDLNLGDSQEEGSAYAGDEVGLTDTNPAYDRENEETRRRILDNIMKREGPKTAKPRLLPPKKEEEKPERTSTDFFKTAYDNLISKLEEMGATHIVGGLEKAKENSKKGEYGEALESLKKVHQAYPALGADLSMALGADLSIFDYVLQTMWDEAEGNLK